MTLNRWSIGTIILGIIFILLSIVSYSQGNIFFLILNLLTGIGLIVVKPFGMYLAFLDIICGGILNAPLAIKAIKVMQNEKNITLLFASIMVYLFYFVVLFYLTRPKVREQFE